MEQYWERFANPELLFGLAVRFFGVFLVLIIVMTLLADRLAPHDPIKFVGAPFNRPRAQQSVVVLESDGAIQGVQGLVGRSVGVVLNTQASNFLYLGGPWQTSIEQQQYVQFSLSQTEALVDLIQELELPVGRPGNFSCPGQRGEVIDVFFPTSIVPAE